jgi:hypothetical protein
LVGGGEQTRVVHPSALRRRRRRRLRRLGRLFYALAAVLVVVGGVVVVQRDTPTRPRVAASSATTPTTIRSRPAITVATSPAPSPAAIPINVPDAATKAKDGNTAPVIAAPHAAIVARTGNSPISGISLADAEAAPGDVFGVLLLSASGRITVPNSNLLQFYGENGSHYVPFSGTLDAIRVALGGTRYTPDAGSSNNSLVILATDFGHGGKYALLASRQTVFLELR